MPLCLDTSIAVELLKSRPDLQVRQRFQEALETAPVWIGSVAVHELMTGALKGERAHQDLERLDRFLTRLGIAELTGDDAIGAARVRAELEGRGAKIGPLDNLIAGQALARNWTLATCDLKHMLRVEGLSVVDWTRSNQPIDRNELLANAMRQLGPAELMRRARQEPEEDK
jgi:tRNA(fMet)-specific endonuclease VapC